MYVIATTKKVAILRRFVDFSDLKCQEPENVLSRDMSRAPYKTQKKKAKIHARRKKNEKNETITYTVGWFMKKKGKSLKNVYPSLQY